MQKQPILGERFLQAFQLSSSLHEHQNRKSTSVPYIAHLIAVSSLVLEANAHCEFDDIEDLAIAALLHDSIEDQGHQISLAEIKQRFGETVCQIVEDCSDAIIQDEEQKKGPWKERKQAYLQKLAQKSKRSQMVSIADKLHNARSIMFDYGHVGESIWDRFNTDKAEILWYYESLLEVYKNAWPNNPLLPSFTAVVKSMRAAVENKA